MLHDGEPQVLRPFHRDESLSVAEAKSWATKSPRTIREWCLCYDLGRKIRGQWHVSKIALQMFLDGNHEALRRYLAGDRSSADVVSYFERLGVPLPRRRAA